MKSRVFPGLLDIIINGTRGKRRVGFPREVEVEIADYFEECSLGRCTPSHTSGEYSIEDAMKDYINFIYCALLLQYRSSMNIEVDEFMEVFLKLKFCVSSKIQSKCSDPLLKSRIREVDDELLVNYHTMAEGIHERCEGSVSKIMKSYRTKSRKLIRECDIDISLEETTLMNKKAAISCLWTLFSSLKAVKLARSGRTEKERVHCTSKP